MELNWSTFVLEILNFLVLVWILKHFLYRPVLAVIASRRAGIEQTLADATKLHAEAEELKTRYEGRLAEWERERAQARAALASDLESERARRLADMQAVLEQEREKARVGEARRRDADRRRYAQAALEQGAQFAARLLEHACGRDTETRLVERLIDGLNALPDERARALRDNQGETPGSATVSSAFPLPDDQRRRLQQALATVCGPDTVPEFVQDSTLLAGVRITVGPWVLGANVRDELKAFAELSHAG